MFLPCEPADTAALRWSNRLWHKVDSRKARAAAHERAEQEIVAFVGANGSGKTWGAVYTAAATLLNPTPWVCSEPDHRHTHDPECPFLRRGECRCGLSGQHEGHRRVLATLPLFDPYTGEPHALADELRSYQQLFQVEHSEVLLDEATGVADSQDHHALPSPVRNMLSQLRKRDLRLLWTAVDYSNAHNRIRQATRAVVYASGGARVKQSDGGRVWRQARRLRLTMYSTEDFENFTATQRMDGTPLSLQIVWRPGHLVDRMYPTGAYAFALGVATDGGTCLGCGGQRSKPRCTCEPDDLGLPPGVVEEIDARGTRRRRVEVVS